MGYACPVCDERQVDAEHLANHVAFTAMIHGDEHETFLDEQADDWGEMGPETLGPILAEHAEQVEVEAPDSDDDARKRSPAVEPPTDPESMSAEDRAVLEEARELTRQMLEDDETE